MQVLKDRIRGIVLKNQLVQNGHIMIIIVL